MCKKDHSAKYSLILALTPCRKLGESVKKTWRYKMLKQRQMMLMRMLEKEKRGDKGKQEEQLTKFFYKANQLDEVLYFDNGKLKRKLGFLYKSNGLIDAIVERNLDEKSVRIYYFMYRLIH